MGYDSISTHMFDALVATEDERFMIIQALMQEQCSVR